MSSPSPASSSDFPASRTSRWWLLGLMAVSAGTAYAIYIGSIEIPERFNPWAPLDVMATPNFLTPYKLSRARSEPVRCLQALEQTAMQYDVLPDRVTGPGCGFDNAVRLHNAGIRFGAPLSLSCPMALSFFMWERHALQDITQAAFGERVVAIDHFGSYACRNINRGEGPVATGARSQHATADALDIAAFTLSGGRRISVTQWSASQGDAGKATTAWLRAVHAGSCRYFKGVLGPDYNAAHRDHFHLETGGYGMCR
jgi:hypothetical protein